MNDLKQAVKIASDKGLVEEGEYKDIKIIGKGHSGKSTLMERLAELLISLGVIIFDMYCELDENLFWLINSRYNAVLIHPSYVRIDVPDLFKDRVQCVYDSTSLERILRIVKKGFPNKEPTVIILCVNAYVDDNELARVIMRYLREIRLEQVTISVGVELAVLIREASDLVKKSVAWGRVKTALSEEISRISQKKKHYWTSFILDHHLYNEVRKDMRGKTDLLLIKNIDDDGDYESPVHRIYSWINSRKRAILRNPEVVDKEYALEYLEKKYPLPNLLEKDEFYMWTSEGKPEVCRFSLPVTFHHKEKKENFCRLTGFRFVSSGHSDELVNKELDQVVNKILKPLCLALKEEKKITFKEQAQLIGMQDTHYCTFRDKYGIK